MAANQTIDIDAIRRELIETKLALENAMAQIAFDNARAIANQNRAIAITKLDCEIPLMRLQQGNIELITQITELTNANQKLMCEKTAAENALQAIRTNMQLIDGHIVNARAVTCVSTTPTVTK